MLSVKDQIIAEIKQLDDDLLLDYIHALLKPGDTAAAGVILSQQEKDSLRMSLQQLKNGQVIPDDEVQKEIDKWLTK